MLLSSAALAGCVRSEDAGTIATAKSHVSLTAGIETRTDISDPNSPVWSAGDAIGVHFVGGDEINHHRLESTSADGGRTATFEGDVTLDAGDYTIYGYYPHGEAGGLTAHHQTAKIEIPSVQRPTATSFDPAADIMVMWPINHSHNGTDITHAGLQFKRVLGMLKFVLTAPELNGEAISELTFTTDAGLELAGMGHFDLTDGTFLEFYDGAATSVTALPAGVHADGTDAIMLCVPVMTIATGVEMTITGETESFTFEKSLTVADPVQLQPGGWHTMNITLYKIFGPHIALTAISENGRYIAGYNSDAGMVIDVTKLIYVFNEETGEMETGFEDGYVVPVYTPENNPEMTVDFVFAVQAVDNNGNAYPMSVTPDGSIMVNYRRVSGREQPFIIENGIEKDLPLPTEYYVIPEDFRGAQPDYISADGNVIVGRFHTYSPYVSMYWKKNGAGEYECGSIARELVVTQQSGPYTDMIEYPVNQPASGASFNGRYAYGSIHRGTNNSQPRRPYIFDIETGVTTLVPNQTSANATAATDDGILFFATPYSGGGLRTPYVFENGTTRTLAEWVKENYDLDIPNSGTVRIVSRDKKVVVWFENSVDGYVNHILVVK